MYLVCARQEPEQTAQYSWKDQSLCVMPEVCEIYGNLHSKVLANFVCKIYKIIKKGYKKLYTSLLISDIADNPFNTITCTAVFI